MYTFLTHSMQVDEVNKCSGSHSDCLSSMTYPATFPAGEDPLRSLGVACL